MFTTEHEFDCTVITTLDEGGNYEDVELIMDETSVFIAQLIPGTDKRQVLELSIQQLKDILVSMDLPQGAYYQRDKQI